MFFLLEIWNYTPEMAAFTYFRCVVGRWKVWFYKQKSGPRMFHMTCHCFISATQGIAKTPLMARAASSSYQ